MTTITNANIKDFVGQYLSGDPALPADLNDKRLEG